MGRFRWLSAAALLALALGASGCSLLGGGGPSDDDMEAMEQAEEQIQACEEDFLEDGYVPADRREEAAEAVGELAEAFLDKGAEAVVANSDTILTVYNTRMLYETVNMLCQVNPEDGAYYSLEEALELAKTVWGASDAERFGGIGARPEIFGGNHARAFCLEGAEPQPETDAPETAVPEITAPETQPAANAEAVLRQYADSLTCLYGDGAIYTSYFVKEAGESGYPTIRYSFEGSFPLEPLGTLLLDFDRDGTQELLVVDVNPDYTLCLKMYEAVDGAAQCVSQCNLAATVVGQSESGYLDCVYYEQNGQTVIGFEERSTHRHIADGVLIRFAAVVYDGANLTVLGSPEYMGSDGMDYGFTEEMAALGIPVDFSEVFGGRSIFSYLPSPVVFSISHTTCTWEMDEWLDFYMTWSRENTSETVEASVIEFR